MPLPKIPTSVAFYLRQLWFYNLGVHLITASGENGYMQTWLESEAGRGANEICSGLLAFTEAAEKELTQSKHLIAWSDSCGGQNKNFTMVTFWQYLLLKKKFDIIDHKFPEVGHSYMDSDRDFGLIEKSLSKVERIHSANEYRELLKNVKTKQPFVVLDIGGGMVNADNLLKAMKLTKRRRNRNNEVVEFRAIRWLRVEKFGFYKYRLSFDESEEWKEVDITGRRFSADLAIDLSSAEFVLPLGRQVKAAKLADLKKQLPYIPRIFHGFYNSILPKDNDNDSDTCSTGNENGQDDDEV